MLCYGYDEATVIMTASVAPCKRPVQKRQGSRKRTVWKEESDQLV